MRDEQAIPASIAAVWGLDVRPKRGPRRALTIERIVDAGVTVAAAEGLGAVSMQRVAAELGTSAMTLYRYVSSKVELLTLMADAALGPPPEIDAADGWRAGLTRWAREQRAAFAANPWALRIPVGGPPIVPNQIRWMEHALRTMSGTAATEAEKMSVILLISGYVRNVAALESDLMEHFFAGDVSPDQAMADYAQALARVTDVRRFPALTAVLASGVMERADPPDHEFIWGLDRILDGIASIMRDQS